MKIKKKQLPSIIYGLFSIYVIWNASQLKSMSANDLGHGFLPFWTGVAMLILSIAWFIKSGRAAEQETAADGGEEKHKPETRRLLMLIGAMFVTAILINVLGYFVSLGLLSLFIAWVMERNKGINPIKTFGVLVGVEVVIYLIFGVWIGTAFPTGLLF